MRVFLLAFLTEGFISLMLKGSILEQLRENLIFIYILLNTILLLCWFGKKSKDKNMFYILAFGLIARIIAMYYDRNVAVLPFNNGDAYKFQELSVLTAEALPDNLLSHFTGLYSQILGVIYYVFGSSQYWGHFLNISFVMLAATKIIDIADILKIKLKNQNILLALWLFMPIPFLMGYALLREGSIYYFTVLSVYFFLKWYDKLNSCNLLMALTCVFIAGSYHGGMFTIALPYVYTYLFLDRRTKKIKFSIINILTLIVMAIAAYLIINKYGDEIYGRVTADTGGGSAYLTNIEINNPIQLIIYGPIKQIFLLFSPMIWLIRNPLDIATLLFDSSLYMYAAYIVVKNFKYIEWNIKTLVICFIIGTFVYGLGSLNTGTAIRHKNKFQSIMIISLVYIIDRKEKIWKVKS